MDSQQIPTVQAYLYRGMWVADCPREGCANTEMLADPVSGAAKSIYVCSNCQPGQLGLVIWPDQEFMALAEAVLSRRPLPDTRNWFPDGHPNATSWGVETGQSIDDLRRENELHGVAAG